MSKQQEKPKPVPLKRVEEIIDSLQVSNDQRMASARRTDFSDPNTSFDKRVAARGDRERISKLKAAVDISKRKTK